MLPPSLVDRIAGELSLAPRQVASALALFADGNTLPFVARYRKEATGGLDEVQLRDVHERAEYLTELEARRAAILASVADQGKLDPPLEARLRSAETKQALEDLYLPYKPKRRTRAMIAAERGLGPLAELAWDGAASDGELAAAATAYVSAERDVPALSDALQGARDILAERIAEDAELRGWVRDRTRERGTVRSDAVAGKTGDDSKFKDYASFSAKLADVKSHQMLAIRRGEAEGELSWAVAAPLDEIHAEVERRAVGRRRAHEQLSLAARDAYKRLLAPSIEVELRLELKSRADDEAIRIFGQNLEQLLLAPPAGGKAVIGLDPGFRTGVKVAAVSATGALVSTDTLYLHQPERLAQQLAALVARSGAELIAVGNGTASRETEAAARAVAAASPTRPTVVVVNEAGASVYSASDVAREEFPELDVSLRGAVSIARRLQDPLAELVKIDPKSIGVGQYQHDVAQPKLKKRLDDVVESCVNRVGVEVNTASAQLLSYVAGIGPSLAQNVVRTRDERGGFRSRRDILDVPRLGAKAFEQSAGFLRVRGGAHPLDASAVHPERYAVVERMARDVGADVGALLADEALVDRIDPERYVGDGLGAPTLRDILSELRKPGRDPRSTFEPPAFRDDVTEPKDLVPGMQLDGVVTNVVAFGAFVDVGVHQDGLVHVSQLADRFIADANQVVKVGQRVKVRVVSVDLVRQRIALSMKPEGSAATGGRDGAGAGTRPAGAPHATPSAGRAGTGKPATAKPPAGKPTAGAPGSVAPNGMRFK